MFFKNFDFREFFTLNRKGLTRLATVVFCLIFILWVIFKSLQPAVKSFCVYVLEQDDMTQVRQNRIVSVEGEVAKVGLITKRISTVGKTKANAAVIIRSEMHGRVKKIDFTEGATVRAGQAIILLEDADLQAEVKQARAEVALRKADFERVDKLHQQKIGSLKEYDKSRVELDVSNARLDLALAKLDKAVIKAPFEGTIGLINISEGAYVQAGQDLVPLVDSTPIKVDFKVPEKNIHDIGVGQKVEIRIDAFKDRIFNGTVEAVDSQVEAESHSIMLRATIPNESQELRAGLFANISLIIGEQGESIMIDESAVDREGEIEFVWIAEKGKAMRRRVLTGTREQGKIELIAGIKSGQIVITAGQLKLSDGVRVKVANLEMESEKKSENPGQPSVTEGADKEDTGTPAAAAKNETTKENTKA